MPRSRHSRLSLHGRGRRGKDVRCAPYATFGTQALADHVVAALAGRNACLLSHHGMIAAETTFEAARALAIEVETLVEMYWRVLEIGDPTFLSDAEMERVVDKFATYRNTART